MLQISKTKENSLLFKVQNKLVFLLRESSLDFPKSLLNKVGLCGQQSVQLFPTLAKNSLVVGAMTPGIHHHFGQV